MMQGHDMMVGWGGMWFGTIMMFAIPLLVILLAIWLFRALTGSGSKTRTPSSSRQILDERFAKGEIDQEEYKHRCHVLGG